MAGPIWYKSGGTKANDVIKSSTGYLLKIAFTNESASTRWFMIFDAAALPGDGAAPLLSVQLPAGGNGSMAFYDNLTPDLPFTNGMVWASSTTAGTLTHSTGADFTAYGAFL